MSRVSYVMMNPGAEHDLTRAIRGCVNDLIADLCAQAGDDVTDVLALTVVGNPIMHHLFLGLDPTELGGAPFALATDQAVDRDAAAAGPDGEPRRPRVRAAVHRRPRGGRHRRRDPVRGAVPAGDREPHRRRGHERGDRPGQPRPPAGGVQPHRPRLRGRADLVRPARGARRDRARPDRPRHAGAALPGDRRRRRGPTSPASTPPRSPACAARASSRSSPRCSWPASSPRTASIDGALADRTPRVFADGRTFSYLLHEGTPRLAITQDDVRAIQLAKAALYAGCRLLMDHLGIDTVDRIRLAGAFGAHIDPVHAMVLGLVPDCDPAQVTCAGNAAGTGARIALFNRAARGEIEQVVRRVEKIETALEPRFQEHFVGGDGHPPRHRPLPAAGRRGAPACTAHRRAPVGAAAPPPRPGRHRRRHRPVRREEHDMSDTAPGRRTGGRAGRASRPAGAHRRARSLHHAELTPYEVLSEEGVSLIEENADTILEQVGIDFSGAPDALALLKDAGADVDGERVRFPRGMCRTLVQATAPQEFDAVRAQPEEQRAHRRRRHGVRALLRHAVRAGPRRRTPLRHDRGLPQHREDVVRHAVPAPLGRHGLRARRPAGEQAPLRHGLRAHALLGQALHGLGHAPATGAGHGRHGADPLRARTTLEDHASSSASSTRTRRSCGTRRCSAPRRPTPRRTRR